MVDETSIADHTLALLRRIDERTERTERMAEDLHDLEVPMPSVEANLAAMNRRMDRFESRLERIGHRAFRRAGGLISVHRPR